MEINNLAQFKRAMKEGHRFKILEQYVKPQYTGQIRRPQRLQTNGMYTGIDGDRTAEVSLQNGGRGSWIEFGKASDWQFCGNGICVQHLRNGKPIWKIQVLDKDTESVL